MEFNNRDKKILKILYDSKDFLTIYSITQKLNPKISGYRELSDKSSSIRQRINKLKKHNFVIEKKKGNKKFYGVDKKKMIFSNTSTLKIQKGRKFDFDNVLLIKEGEVWRFEQLITE